MHRTLLAVSLVVASLNAFAREIQVPVTGRGVVVLSVPDSWDEIIDRSDPSAPPTVTLVPSKGKAFQVLISVIWPSRAEAPNLTRETLRKQVQRASEGPKEQAVERELPVVDFSGSSGFGAYFSATDRAPEPDGFKYLTQGMFAMSDVRITFTILVNGEPAPVVQQALQTIKTMRREPVKSAS